MLRGLGDRIKGAIAELMGRGPVAPGLKAALDRDDDTGWRRLTDKERQLDSMSQERMQRVCYWLWLNNPLARWIVETTVSFIAADGLPYTTADDRIQEALDEFWSDPLNDMQLGFARHVREMEIFGELMLPVFTSSAAGDVRLGYIDPSQIDQVVTDPYNVKVVVGVTLKPTDEAVSGKRYKTILPEGAEAILSPEAQALREGYVDGECFYFALNGLTNSVRGVSSLRDTADIIDLYDNMIYDMGEKGALLNFFLWDLLVEGGDTSQIREMQAQVEKRSGSIFGHNERVQLKALAPDLKAQDFDRLARLVRNHILGRHNLPEHWYGGGGDVNLATAQAMGAPAYKALAAKQRHYIGVLTAILAYVVRAKTEAGLLDLKGPAAKSFTVSAPELETTDIAKLSSAVDQVSRAVAMAEVQGWVDKDTARKVFARALGLIGIEIDTEAIAEAVAGQPQGYEDYTRPAPGAGGGGNA